MSTVNIQKPGCYFFLEMRFEFNDFPGITGYEAGCDNASVVE